MAGDNITHLWTLVEYVCKLNALQVAWIICADWNMELSCLQQAGSLEATNGVAFTSEATTCRQTEPGTIYDFFVASVSLAPRLGPRVSVEEDCTSFPHLPVTLPLRAKDTPMWTRVTREPAPITAVPPIGCARPPVYPWRAVLDVAAPGVTHRDDLWRLWDLVVQGIELELAFRWDKVGLSAEAPTARTQAPSVKWKKLAWAPPKNRTYKDGSTRAWATALRWAKHVGKARAHLASDIEKLQASAAMYELFLGQCTKLLQAFTVFPHFMRNVSRC